MTVFTMGFTQKSAEEFFGLIEQHNVEMLIDIRLNNQSQLAGFTKGRDLAFFLASICGCKYDHMLPYAPTKEILDGYKKGTISWADYEIQYNELISKRGVEDTFSKRYSDYNSVLLLCSEPTPECCHRRLLAEYLSNKLGVQVIHI